jgi:hypothetical protein
MTAAAWKVIAATEKDGAPQKEYFLVVVPDRLVALETVRLRRPDLKDAVLESVGEATSSFIEWLQVQDGDVLSIMALSR